MRPSTYSPIPTVTVIPRFLTPRQGWSVPILPRTTRSRWGADLITLDTSWLEQSWHGLAPRGVNRAQKSWKLTIFSNTRSACSVYHLDNRERRVNASTVHTGIAWCWQFTSSHRRLLPQLKEVSQIWNFWKNIWDQLCQERLNGLATYSIEKDISKNIDLNIVVINFASTNAQWSCLFFRGVRTICNLK